MINSINSYESQFYEWLPWVGRYQFEMLEDKTLRKKLFKDCVLNHPRCHYRVLTIYEK